MEVVIWGNTYRIVILENPAGALYYPRLYTIFKSNSTQASSRHSELLEMTDLETSLHSRLSCLEEEEPISIEPRDIKNIKEIMARDMDFLKDMRIINYSLEVYVSNKLETSNCRKTYRDSAMQNRIVMCCIANILKMENQKTLFANRRISCAEYRDSMNDAITGLLRNDSFLHI
jgi:hypothetical protein